ncbi:hypothetical protein H8S95_17330 [Pontibacter sp. KCTC 32443]|uniref:hypothetical protein n=1 Tax=Pontibacter TaxID=323449 RepID=UPI00164EAD01|nr:MULTISPECIES: hypothetical protein [Pontibacter]MBC5775841.1 hypothetical protein [Pontibacter sp. KCTC 32443]
MQKFLSKVALAFIAICAFAGTSMAQGINISLDGESMQAFGKGNLLVKGSPYLYKDWSKGSVKLTNGVVYEGMNLMYDQTKDMLIFKADGEQRQKFLHPVQEFILQEEVNNVIVDERTFRNGYPLTDGIGPAAFYEVLADGKTQLLKRISKSIVEEREDNSITKTKMYKESVRYYLATDGKLTKISKNKKAVFEALGKDTAALDKYIKDNKLNIREDNDLAKLVTYANTI